MSVQSRGLLKRVLERQKRRDGLAKRKAVEGKWEIHNKTEDWSKDCEV